MVRTFSRLGLLAILLAAIGALLLPRRGRAATQGQPPYGIEQRAAWGGGRVSGSPEPPAPFKTVRAFPQLTFNHPLDAEFVPGARRVCVVEQGGKVFTFPDDDATASPELMLEGSQLLGLDKVPNCKGVNSFYSLVFHPKFAQNHYVYVAYILSFTTPGRNHENGSRVSRFTVNVPADAGPPRVDPKSEQVVLEWLEGGHNGVTLKFGPADGCLYVSTGDGGDPDPPDPFNSGQDIGDLLCSVLRLDVDHAPPGKPYAIPADNPFVKTPGARGEVYAYGFRNPWRMSFDRVGGQLWVGDVGWELWESICCAKAGSNYGWSITEGPNPVHPDGKRGPTPISPPNAALPHSEAASITGGIVYHGSDFPDLANQYIFGDWQTRRLWAAKVVGEHADALEPYREIAQTNQQIVSFAEHPETGELLIVDYSGGGLWRMARNEAPASQAKFARKLSETGLFTDTAAQSPAPGVLPFAPSAAQWVDGATTQWWVAVPGTQPVTWGKGVWGDPSVAWPKDSVLARTFSLDTAGGGKRRVETQLLHFDGQQFRGYSYAWNEQQTDADLVPAGGAETVVPNVADSAAPGGAAARRWSFDSRAQCLTCHNPWTDYTLAFNPTQLDHPVQFGDVSDTYLRTFRHVNLVPAPLPASTDAGGQKRTLSDPYDATANLDERARSYLHVNCSHCHRFGGGGSALFDVRKELTREKTNLVDVRPNLGSFGIEGASLVAAGDPTRSVLFYRMAKLGRGRMPHIGSDRVDDRGLKLLADWIRSLAQTQPPVEHVEAVRTLSDPAAAPAAADWLLGSTRGALALICALQDGKVPPAARDAVTAKGYGSKDEAIRDLFRRFDPAEANANRLGAHVDPAKLLARAGGDATRGRAVFFGADNAGLCGKCHIVNGQGTDFGPDLSHIATKYNRADLLDNILYPSKTILQGYATFNVTTKQGETHSGFLISRTEQEVVIKDVQRNTVHIPAADVKKMSQEKLSAMPEGLLGDLEAGQAADLLEFLSTLK